MLILFFLGLFGSKIAGVLDTVSGTVKKGTNITATLRDRLKEIDKTIGEADPALAEQIKRLQEELLSKPDPAALSLIQEKLSQLETTVVTVPVEKTTVVTNTREVVVSSPSSMAPSTTSTQPVPIGTSTSTSTTTTTTRPSSTTTTTRTCILGLCL